jgi:hypothetical protein
MSTPTPDLTPYDTGAILEPKLHPGTTGKVDFDDDESATIITLDAKPTQTDGLFDVVTVTIDTHGDEDIAVVVNGVRYIPS